MEKNEYSIIDNYIFKNDIGEGNFGKVKLCIFKKTGEKFAVKIMNKNQIKLKMKNKIFQENKIITKFNHLNVISVFEIIEDFSNYYIIMEYCENGEFFDYILSHQKLSEEECSFFFYQIINGVEHIHSKGFAHRDLKLENILLTQKYILKIIDFGLSHEFKEDGELLNTKCGSPSYASPEIVLGKPYDGFKSDIWSCGIILFSIATGYMPFAGENITILFRDILKCKPVIPGYLSNDIKSLILSILTRDPNERINIENIKKHEFYLKGKQLFEKKYKNILESKNLKEKNIKETFDKDYDVQEEKKINENENNQRISNFKMKYITKKNESCKNKNKFNAIKIKNSEINFRNKVKNINYNLNSINNTEFLNEKMNNILIGDVNNMNTIATNKINKDSIYSSIINNLEKNKNQDISKDKNKNNKSYKHIKIENKSKNKGNKLNFHRRNKIGNIIPYLKASEASPTNLKLLSYGRSQKMSNKNNSEYNTRNPSSKHSSKNKDSYRKNTKSNNQRLSTYNNMELINKFNYYLIGKKAIPKNRDSNKKDNNKLIKRYISSKNNSFKTFKTYNNSQIPFYNFKSKCLTRINNNHSNDKDNSTSENSKLNQLFTKYTNYNNNLKRKLSNKIFFLAKNGNNISKKNITLNKSYHPMINKNLNSNNEKKNKINKIIKTKKQFIKVKNNNNKIIKSNEDSNTSKSNSNLMKSLKINSGIKNNNVIKNLKKTIYINNFINKNNNLPFSSFNNKNRSSYFKLFKNNFYYKKSSFIYLMQNNFNMSKTSKSNMRINLSCSSQINSKKNINKSCVQKFSLNNNNSLNISKTKLNNISNSNKKRFYSKKNIYLRYIPSNNGSEIKYINKNTGKDILLNKLKKLKMRNKNINNLCSFSSMKIFKKKYFSNFFSRRESYEKTIKKIDYSGLGNNITMNCGYKYISKYGKELLKRK